MGSGTTCRSLSYDVAKPHSPQIPLSGKGTTLSDSNGWKGSDFLKLLIGIGVIIAIIALIEALGRADGSSETRLRDPHASIYS